MSDRSRFLAFVGELRKLAAFVRRDALTAFSYRAGLAADIVALLSQAVIFFFFGFLVDPGRMPQLGGTRADYMAFVAVGITFAGFFQMGVSRMMGAIRNEQLLGTLEALLVTPTAPTTIQLGLVIYDLLRVPLRAGLFLAIASMLFGVDLRWSGIGPAAVIMLTLLPFVWGVAAAWTAVVMTVRQAASIIGFINYGLLLGSGAYFPLDILPPWLASIAAANPLAMSLNGARAALLGGVGWGVLPPLAPSVLLSLVTWLVGTLAFRIALERERRAGTLGLY